MILAQVCDKMDDLQDNEDFFIDDAARDHWLHAVLIDF